MSKNELKKESIDDNDITDEVGSFIKDVSVELRSYIGVPKSMILPIILPIMSTAIGTKATTFSGSMEKLRVNLWTIVIGSSGTSGKSTTLQILKSIVLDGLEEKLKDDYRIAKVAYSLLKSEEKENADEPRMQHIYSGQGSTFAGMIKNLSFNQHGLLSTFDEGSEFLNKMLNDKQHKASFTSLYAQSSYGKDLVGKEGTGEQIWLDNPFISLILVSNPHWFNSDVKNSDFVSGFLNRFSIYHMKDTIHMEPFKNREKHDFSKFQNVAVKIWEYLSNLEKCLEMPLSDESIARYQKWYKDNNFDAFDEEWESEEYAAFLVRQKTAVIKYAMIIQIFDTFYEGGEKLGEEIELKYMNIGITIAEETMSQIKSFLEYRQATKDSLKYREDDYLEIARKVKNYLKKYNFDENNPLPSSKLTRQVRGLNKTNFQKVLEFASSEYGIRSESIEHKDNRVVTYYFFPSYVDSWGSNEGNTREELML